MKKILSFILSAMMLTSGMAFVAGAAEGDTEITSLTTPPTKMWGVTEGTVNAPVAAETETNIDGVKLTPVWAGADGFEFGEAAEGDTVIAYTATYTAPDGYVFAESFEKGENVTVSADGKTLTYKLYSYVIPADAIYISEARGEDSTEERVEGNYTFPYKTLDFAMTQLESKGGGTIVVLDTSTNATANVTKRTGDYTIVGWDANSTFITNTGYKLRANTTIRDITLDMQKANGGIYANGFNFTIGDERYTDVIVTSSNNASGSKQLFALGDGEDYSGVSPKITINSGDFSILFGAGYGSGGITAANTNISLEVNGGTIGTVRGGFIAGDTTVDNTLTGDVSIAVNGGKVNDIYVAASSARYIHNGDATVTINGGTVGNIYATTATSKTVSEVTYTPVQNGDTTIKINGGTITGKITNTPADQIKGTTVVDIIDYDGDITALAKKITASQFDVVKSTIIYVDSANGKSGNDGFTAETALDTMTNAFKKFAGGVGGKIIICGEYATTSGFTDTAGRGEVVITGLDSNAEIAFHRGFTLLGDTTFENIHFEVMASYKTISAAGNKLVMGDGITVGNNGVTANRLQLAGVNGGAAINAAETVNMVINSGTYGTVSAVGTLYGGYVPGDVNVTINGGTFEGGLIIGSYCSAGSMTNGLIADKSTKDNSGTIGGAINLTINGGEFPSEVRIGGKQYGTIGSINAKINGGTFNNAIKLGSELASAENVAFGDSENYSYTTDVLGDAILEITGGKFNSSIAHTGNVVKGKAAVVVTNGTAANVTPAGFDYVVKASKKGTVAYDATTDKFSIVPSNSILDIHINETLITKTEDNVYTLSGGTDNVYNIVFGGESDISEKFMITSPVPELTPVSEILLHHGASAKETIPLSSCSASKVAWEPADSKFKYDTQYTATVILTANEGIQYSDEFGGLVINGGYAGNTVNCTLSEDSTQITVKVTFPKTPKEELELLAESKTPVSVSFTTSRSESADTEALKATTITFTNINDDTLSEVVTATENGSEGTYSGEIVSGLYNVSVKKQGYIEQVKEAVYIAGSAAVAIDFGALTAGDIVDNEGTTAGNGKVDIDDFVVAIRAFGDSKGGIVWNAADIDENGTPSVQDLVHIKDNFANTTADISDYDGYFENTYYRLTVDKKLTVGYIGGSIIQGASDGETHAYDAGNMVEAGNAKFIDRMQKLFEDNFPDAEINSINAGLSDTGSNMGIFRLESDLMLREEGYIPDLVFLEFAVNDFAAIGADRIKLQYESLINNVYRINPKADIICVLTAMQGYEVPKAAHIEVANYYDIPIADVGAALKKEYTITGDYLAYTRDNLHANSAGYEYFTKICWDILENYIIKAAPTNPKYEAKVLPAAKYGSLLTNPIAVPMTSDIITLGNLTEGTTHAWESGKTATKYSRVFDAVNKNYSYIKTEQEGDIFTFSFTGDAFGFIIYHQSGKTALEYSLDGGTTWTEYSVSKSYKHYQTYLVATDLEKKTHTVTVRKSASSDNPLWIGGIFYNQATAAE